MVVPTLLIIRFTVPLPPKELRGNARAHWAARKHAADAYSEAVMGAYWGLNVAANTMWERAHVVYTWRYAGAAPDIDNIARSVKVLQDTICCAPANARQGDYSDRYFLGIVRNDSGIEATFRREKVATRAEEGVLVEIERRDR